LMYDGHAPETFGQLSGPAFEFQEFQHAKFALLMFPWVYGVHAEECHMIEGDGAGAEIGDELAVVGKGAQGAVPEGKQRNIVVAGNDKQRCLDLLKKGAGRFELLGAGAHGEIAGNDDEIRMYLVYMGDKVF